MIKWQLREQRALEKIDPAHLALVKPCVEVRAADKHQKLIEKIQAVWPHEAYVDYSNPVGHLTPPLQANPFQEGCALY
ncbi:hypothetical protein EGJ50_20100 [Pseudomonas luteola]|nr:hypothetical protein EGJ50_20100 [Pseudomonas luteola]